MKFILQSTGYFPELEPTYLEELDKANIKYELFKSKYQRYVTGERSWKDMQGCIIDLTSIEDMVKLSNICQLIVNTYTDEKLYEDYLGLPVIEFYDDYIE